MTSSKITHHINGQEFPCNRDRAQDVHNSAGDEVSTGIDNWTPRQSRGVVAGVTPFNPKGVDFTMPVAR